MRRSLAVAGVFALVCAGSLGVGADIHAGLWPGGASGTAQPDASRRALTTHRPDLDGLAGLDARIGQALFERLWVSAPASTRAADGLGPLYNARACSACHVNHGRGIPPAQPDDFAPGLVVRLAGPDGGPDPVLGHQIQPLAVAGLPAEARVRIDWIETGPVILPGGERVRLRRPAVQLSDFGWGPPAPETRAGLRIAPAIVGAGLIERIPDAQILAPAPNRDGITGRVRMAAPLPGAEARPGRFGRRAGFARLEDATTAALAFDLGLSTPAFPAPWGDCTDAQPACRTAPHGDGDARVHEVTAGSVDLIAQHLRALAVPPRRGADAAARQGEALFAATGCTACHRPAFVIDTARGPEEIRPYSDFRLHDLGPGLAEDAPEAGVAPGEWRTTPLWALGRVADLGGAGYLHDGRARTLTEAILWHGGAAAPARARFARLQPGARADLLSFLESL